MTALIPTTQDLLGLLMLFTLVFCSFVAGARWDQLREWWRDVIAAAYLDDLQPGAEGPSLTPTDAEQKVMAAHVTLARFAADCPICSRKPAIAIKPVGKETAHYLGASTAWAFYCSGQDDQRHQIIVGPIYANAAAALDAWNAMCLDWRTTQHRIFFDDTQ